jgi:hypothetical protein
MSPDDGRMTETCCGNNIRRGEEELLHWWTINCLINIRKQQGAHHSNHNSSLHIQLTVLSLSCSKTAIDIAIPHYVTQGTIQSYISFIIPSVSAWNIVYTRLAYSSYSYSYMSVLMFNFRNIFGLWVR